MAKLPDIPYTSWINDQVDQFQKSIAGHFPSLEFQDAADEKLNQIPADWPMIGGQDTYEQEQEIVRQKEEQQRQEAEAEYQRQQQEQAAQQAQEAEQARQNALTQQARAFGSSLGIPTPDDIGQYFSGLVGTAPGTGDNGTSVLQSSGANDPGGSPVSYGSAGDATPPPQGANPYDFRAELGQPVSYGNSPGDQPGEQGAPQDPYNIRRFQGGDVPKDPGVESPDFVNPSVYNSDARNIEPLGPALRGATVGPAYMRPGTRDSAFPGAVDEYTEPAATGEGTYPDGWPRNRPVENSSDIGELSPEDERWQAIHTVENNTYGEEPKHPGPGYEGLPLPATDNPRDYPWTENIPQGNQESFKSPDSSLPLPYDAREMDQGPRELARDVQGTNLPQLPDMSPERWKQAEDNPELGPPNPDDNLYARARNIVQDVIQHGPPLGKYLQGVGQPILDVGKDVAQAFGTAYEASNKASEARQAAGLPAYEDPHRPLDRPMLPEEEADRGAAVKLVGSALHAPFAAVMESANNASKAFGIDRDNIDLSMGIGDRMGIGKVGPTDVYTNVVEGPAKAFHLLQSMDVASQLADAPVEGSVLLGTIYALTKAFHVSPKLGAGFAGALVGAGDALINQRDWTGNGTGLDDIAAEALGVGAASAGTVAAVPPLGRVALSAFRTLANADTTQRALEVLDSLAGRAVSEIGALGQSAYGLARQNPELAAGAGAAGLAKALSSSSSGQGDGEAAATGTGAAAIVGAVRHNPRLLLEAVGKSGPVFYSQLERTLADKMPERASVDQIWGLLGRRVDKKTGQQVFQGVVKPDEIKWTGLDDWLNEVQQQGGPVRKSDVLDFLRENRVNVVETQKGPPSDIEWTQEAPHIFNAESGGQKFRIVRSDRPEFRGSSDTVYPASTSYEVMTPDRSQGSGVRSAYLTTPEEVTQYIQKQAGTETNWSMYKLPGGENYREVVLQLADPPRGETRPLRQRSYMALPHWEDEDNALAHVRFQDRTDEAGRKILHIEEVQSDWHQVGRDRGYQMSARERGPLAADLQKKWTDLDEEIRAQDARLSQEPEYQDVSRRYDEARQTSARISDLLDQPENADNDELWRQLNDADDYNRGLHQEMGELRDAHHGNLLREQRQLEDQLNEVTGGGMRRGQTKPPAGPFDNTNKWGDLVMKRMLRYAAEHGYDRMIWTNGADQAERFPGGGKIPEGMTKFYDTQLGNITNKIVKKFGGRVEEHEINVPRMRMKPSEDTPFNVYDRDGNLVSSHYDENEAQRVANEHGGHYAFDAPDNYDPYDPENSTVVQEPHKVQGVDITPSMRQSVMEQGPQPLFAGLPPGLAEGAVGAGAGAGAGASSEDDQNRRPNAALAGAMLGVGAVKLARRLPTKGPWAEKFAQGINIPEGATEAQIAAIRGAWDRAQQAISDSLASKGVAKQIRLKGVANRAWTEYEKAIAGDFRLADTTDPESVVGRIRAANAAPLPEGAIESDATRAEVSGRNSDPEVVARTSEDTSGVSVDNSTGVVETGVPVSEDRPVARPELSDVSREGSVQEPDGNLQQTGGSGSAELNFEPESNLLPATLDPREPVSNDRVAGFFGGLYDDFAGNDTARNLIGRLLVQLQKNVEQPRMRHLQQVLETVAKRTNQVVGRHADVDTEARAWADRWFRREGWLAPAETTTADQEHAIQNAGREASVFPDARFGNAGVAEEPRPVSSGEELPGATPVQEAPAAQRAETPEERDARWAREDADANAQQDALVAGRNERDGATDPYLEDPSYGTEELGGFSPASAVAGAAAGAANANQDDNNDQKDPYEVPLESLGGALIAGTIFSRRSPIKMAALDPALARDPKLRMFNEPLRAIDSRTFTEHMHNFWRNTVVKLGFDDAAALQGAINDLAQEFKKQTGALLPAEVMASTIKRLDPLRAYDMKVQSTFKPLLKQMDDLQIDPNEAAAYLAHMHDIDIARGQSTPGSRASTQVQGNLQRDFPGRGGSSYADSVKYTEDWKNSIIANRGQQVWDDFEKVAQGFWDFGDHILQVARDGQLIDHATYTDWRTRYPHFMPTRIVDMLDDTSASGLGKSLSVNSTGFHALTRGGTTEEAMNPLAALLGSGRETYARARKNEVFNAFVDAWDLASGNIGQGFHPNSRAFIPDNTTARGRRVETFGNSIMPWPYSDKPEKGWTTVEGFRNGVKVKLAVSDELGDVTKFASPTVIPLLSGMMQAFRAGATSRNPVFLTANALLDLAAYINREVPRAGANPGAIARVFTEYGKTAAEFLPLWAGTGAVAGGIAGQKQIQPDDTVLERLGKVGGGMIVGGGLGSLADRIGPGKHVLRDIIQGEYRGDMKRFFEQGGGNASGYYNRSATGPEGPVWLQAAGRTMKVDVDDIIKKFAPNFYKPPLQRELEDLTHHAWEIRSPADMVKLLTDLATLKPVEELGERIELVPRVAAMRLSERRSAPQIAALGRELATARATEAAGGIAPRHSSDVQAALNDANLRSRLAGTEAGRTTTLDFNKGGTWSRTINQIIPFFNVGMQSMADPFRALRESGVAYPATLMSTIVGPMVAAEAWNNGDPERAKDYADVPSYMKDQGMVVMLPKELVGETPVDEQGNRRPQYLHWRYRELAPLAIATRELLQRTVYSGKNSDANRRSILDAATGMVNAVSPIQVGSWEQAATGVVPPVIGTTTQAAFDRDTFRGRRINSKFADERATPLSKAMADAFHIRPSTAEFVSRDLLTGVAGAYHGASELLAGQTKNTPQGAPIVGGLYGRFVKGDIGEGANQAEAHVLTDSARKILEDGKVSWRPAASDPQIDDLNLTRSEYADYQKGLNEATDKAIHLVRDKPGWDSWSPARREEVLQDNVNFSRDNARSRFLVTIPREERARRRAAGRAEANAR